MNVIKTKIISLKLSKTSSKERLDVPSEGLGKVSYIRRFSVPYGQAVESWKKENSLSSCPEEEEYPIYQSASFKRDRRRRHSVSLEEKPNVSEHEESLEKVKDSSLPPLTFLQSDDQDRRPSLAELQSEDMDRRPSITMYQSVDSQHPDVIAIQKLVERMKFGEVEVDS